MNLSAHFTLTEATYSATAQKHKAPNTPSAEVLERMKFTALKMEAVRQLLGNYPIKVTSWYRGPELNRLIGGAPTSSHMRGEAVDFKCERFGSPRDICLKLREAKELLEYDQLILEPTWVHISFTRSAPRKKELTYLGPSKYVAGIK